MRVGSLTPTPFFIRERSRQELLNIRKELVDPTGRLRSGYLRMKPGKELHLGGWFTGGSTTEAKNAIVNLIKNAYCFSLEGEDGAHRGKRFEEALTRYFRKSGDSFGSMSFVKLIDALESGEYPKDDSQEAVSPGAGERRQSPGDRGRIKFTQGAPSSESLSGKKERDARIDQTAAKSGISDTAKAQFKELALHLSPNGFLHFSQLMFPPSSRLNPVKAAPSIAGEAPRTFVMGDADGSIGRMVLHAIASGVAELPKDEIRLLAEVLESEYRCANIAEFQSNNEIAEAHQKITEALTVKPHGHQQEPSCLFLGDILSDRFTNNQMATKDLIYKLRGFDLNDLKSPAKETGVRFIAGNHDTYLIDKKRGSANPQWGGLAVKVLDRKEYKQLLIRCFDAAVYSSGVLSTHQGVAASDLPGYYQTGLHVKLNEHQHEEFKTNKSIKISDGSTVKDSLRLEAKSPEELARKMNESFQSRLQSEDSFEDVIATNFRPDDRHMTPKAMGFDGIPGFRQLHGHNAESNETHAGVTNLNPRVKNEFAPASTVIEYPSQQAEGAQ